MLSLRVLPSVGIITATKCAIGRRGERKRERAARFKLSRRFLDIATIKGKSDVGAKRQRANGKETGKGKEESASDETGRETPLSRDAGGLARAALP